MSEEGQLPQVVEELKDLQVAPGMLLAKFQLKVKGEGGRAGGPGTASCQQRSGSHRVPDISRDPFSGPCGRHGAHWAVALC